MDAAVVSKSVADTFILIVDDGVTFLVVPSSQKTPFTAASGGRSALTLDSGLNVGAPGDPLAWSGVSVPLEGEDGGGGGGVVSPPLVEVSPPEVELEVVLDVVLEVVLDVVPEVVEGGIHAPFTHWKNGGQVGCLTH